MSREAEQFWALTEISQLSPKTKEHLQAYIDRLVIEGRQRTEREVQIRELGWCLRNPSKSIQARLSELLSQSSQQGADNDNAL